ncbi:MAG TPA: hypothetical protein ENJ42_04965 [Hellea balneolensis]|uniref:Hda lid domain-containing protein n=1 Tax=Hellea balneolensis TaxID=287478 RepID=A0A7C5LU40_9PROT|nr:hypothetical protein [Hellea balneolensis]
MATQIPLDFKIKPDFSADAFIVAPCNKAAHGIVLAGNWPNQCLSMIGPKGAGKTHLGHVWAENMNALILYGKTTLEPDTQWKDQHIWLDNADKASELTLFALINMAISGEIKSVLFTSRFLPDAWPVNLPDLQSRLKNLTIAPLDDPDDEVLGGILAKLFMDRGLVVSESVIDYLLFHADRSVEALSRLVHDIDQAAASSKSNVTRPFVARFLQNQLL